LSFSIYFFFEEKVKINPEIVDIILKNRPLDVNMTKYCYSISYKLRAIVSISVSNQRNIYNGFRVNGT